ncbi:MAG: GreA/GreB family elongation factor, partial [Candidatus Kerfeldbacteria bacterium]|nr:GreA/GreB family elongation factor [Candidatus Kerfeldbacteria bacterium]
AMESRYDTWKEEAQYLAGAFQAHNEDLRTQLFALKAIKERSPKITATGVYAVVEVQDVDTDSRTHYFLLPAGGGSVHEFDGMSITVLNLGTPLARAIIGAELDEEFEFKVGAKTRHLCVTAVR